MHSQGARQTNPGLFTSRGPRRILGEMKWKWSYSSLIMVLLGLALLDYILVRSNFPINYPGLWGREVKTAQPDADNSPEGKVVFNDARLKELRLRHHLRPLTEPEDGRKLQDLPIGIYGFSTCSELLDRKPSKRSSLEIHKRRDGIVYYVGYASDEDIGKYLARQKNFHIRIFPQPAEKASSLFEIPVYFVSKCEVRPVQDSYVFDLFVTAIPELHT